MKKYFPILISKAGELTALTQLDQQVKNETAPVISVITEGLSNVEAFLINAWSFQGNKILIDFSLYDDLDDEIVGIRAFFDRLYGANVNAVPVVQQNSPNQYLDLVRDLIAQYACNVCLRTSNQSGGFLNYNNQVNTLVHNLATNSANTLLLLDLGHIENSNYNNLAAVAILSIQALIAQNSNWNEIIVASGSFPENLNGLVANKVYYLDRYEWHVWLLIQASDGLMQIVKYGDYGTKNPIYSEIGFAGTSSIKYTTKEHYVIYRGELPQNHPRGMSQYIDKAAILITTADYSGNGFSWGDSKIHLIVTQNNKPGNPKTWVEISQNHHITLLHSLL